jgi:hypothetical protein
VRVEITKYHLDPEQVIVDALGREWTPKLDRSGNPVIRPTRPGDSFLARSKHVRVVTCHGRHLAGLTRLILKRVDQ